jgi:hypothetical protein
MQGNKLTKQKQLSIQKPNQANIFQNTYFRTRCPSHPRPTANNKYTCHFPNNKDHEWPTSARATPQMKSSDLIEGLLNQRKSGMDSRGPSPHIHSMGKRAHGPFPQPASSRKVIFGAFEMVEQRCHQGTVYLPLTPTPAILHFNGHSCISRPSPRVW